MQENVIYERNRIALFAEYGNPQTHKHFSKHILLSDKPFLCLIEDRQYAVRSMVIQSQTTHSVQRDSGCKMAVFMIDETSDLSKVIDRYCLRERISCTLPQQAEQLIAQRLADGAALCDIDALVMGLFDEGQAESRAVDWRVAEALRHIEESESLDHDIYNALSSEICLSKSRFLHLFKNEVGINLKNYLLLKRMEKVYCSVVQNHMRITDAAVMAGFSSASHFADACKKHYGISLTDFMTAQKL